MMKFLQTIEKYNDSKINLIFDMDGVLAEYDIGNFDYNTIRPLNSIINKVKKLYKQKNIDLKILSICKKDNIIEEKKEWLKKYMPFFDLNNAVFISKEQIKDKSSKEIKSEYIKNNFSGITIVVDDDNEIIKYLKKNNDIILFQISSLID